MKKILSLFLLLTVERSFSTEYLYQIKEGDQLGTILLSLGHKYLWSKDSKLDQFKKTSQVSLPNFIKKGTIIKISDNDIIFKKNVALKNGQLKILRKIRTLKDYEEYLLEETPVATDPGHNKELSIDITNINVPAKKAQKSISFYAGLGTFITQDKVTDRQVISSTFSGIQPLVQLKGIYTSGERRVLALDLLAKKIISSQFSFPINYNFRLQAMPGWEIANVFQLGFTHSFLRQSYVGMNSLNEVSYELRSQFVGISVLHTQDSYWIELYIEKAYRGSTKSSEYTHEVSNGYRVETEISYPVSDKWKVIPGINYYTFESTSDDYSFYGLEARLVFSREFAF